MKSEKAVELVQDSLNPLLSKLEAKTADVGVIGLGYVGLPLALLFGRKGFRVTGFDIDPDKVEKLERGESYIHHIGGGGGFGEVRGEGFVSAGGLAPPPGIGRRPLFLPPPPPYPPAAGPP